MAQLDNDITDAEVLLSAKTLLATHGQKAANAAAGHADMYLCMDNLKGYQLWKRIEGMVDTLVHGGQPEGLAHH